MKTEFACVIKCMDGRIQNVVSAYMRKKFNVPYIDAITVAGPVKVLAENKKDQILNDLKFRAGISVNAHKSEVIAVCGHFDCAMVYATDEEQIEMVHQAVKNVSTWFENVTVIGLFVNSDLEVFEV